MPVYTMVTANGKPAVLLNITRQPAATPSPSPTASPPRSRSFAPSCPRASTSQPFYDQSQLVRESIRSVRDAILIGLLLACVILYLFLRDWRSSLIAGLVIPVTVAVTVLLLWIIGESFNLMTLGGLAAAIGLVIDDAIVVVENIVLHRDAGEDRIEACARRCSEISRPLIGSTITPVVVFLPLIAVTGVTGSFFRALAITMTVSLLTSLLLAVTWTPGLALRVCSSDARTMRRASRLHYRTHTQNRAKSSVDVMRWHRSRAGLVAGTAGLARRSSACCWSPARSSPITASAPTCCRRWTKAASSSTTSCPRAAHSPRPTACSTTSRRFCTTPRKSRAPAAAPACRWASPP